MKTGASRKRILILTQFYAPEPCAASNRVTAFARGLAARADVTVMTGMPNFPWGRVPPPYDTIASITETDEGVRVKRVRSLIAPRLRRGARLLTWLSLALRLSASVLCSRDRYDTVIVSAPPITLALPALLAAWRYRAKLIVDVRDVFPDMGVRLGVWQSNSLPVRAAGWIVDVLYARASAVLAVTQSAREAILARGVPPEKLCVLPNGFDFPELPEFSGRRSPDDFVVVYAGNFGLATGIDLLIDAAKRLQSDGRISFVLIGGGVDAARITARIGSEGLTNVSFLGVLDRNATLCRMREADVTIAPLHSGVTDAIPSKIFDSLGVKCPVVVCASGEAASLIRRARGGVAIPPEDPEALANTLAHLASDRARLREAGERGHDFVRAQFSREHTTRLFVTFLRHLRCA